jgi:hypothetical protein
MSLFSRLPRTAILTVGAAAVAGLVSASLVSAHGGDATAVHACVTPDGSVRITGDPTGFGDPSGVCNDKTGEHALDWAQRGPQGPAGTVAPTHTVSAPLHGSDPIVRNLLDTAEFDTVLSGTASCPDGEFAVGGGYDLLGNENLFSVVTNRPGAGSVPRSWSVRAVYHVPDSAATLPLNPLGSLKGVSDALLQQAQDGLAAAQAQASAALADSGHISRRTSKQITRAVRGLRGDTRAVAAAARDIKKADQNLRHLVVPTSAPEVASVYVVCSGG